MKGTAIVGLGEIGQYHLPALRDNPDAELRVLCDLDLELARSSARGDEEASDDLDSVLARDDVQIVDICLPHDLHAPVAVLAMAAGCDVLLEKPLAVDLAACDSIIAAARESGRRVAVSHNQLLYGPHERLIELVHDGELGRLRTLRARLGIGGKLGAWRSDPARAGGGLLIDAGAHRVYMMRALGGPVAAVSAEMDNPGSEDSFIATFHFESGAIGVIDGSYHGPDGVFDDRLEVFGTGGMAEVAGCEAFFEGYLPDGPQLRVFREGAWGEEAVRDTWDSSVRSSVAASVSALATGQNPPVDGNAGRETVALVDAAYRAASSGERVLFDG